MEHASRSCHFAAAVVPFAEELLHHRVNDHVARASIKCDQFLQRRARRDGREVRNSPNVLSNTIAGLPRISDDAGISSFRCSGGSAVSDNSGPRGLTNVMPIADAPGHRHRASLNRFGRRIHRAGDVFE